MTGDEGTSIGLDEAKEIVTSALMAEGLDVRAVRPRGAEPTPSGLLFGFDVFVSVGDDASGDGAGHSNSDDAGTGSGGGTQSSLLIYLDSSRVDSDAVPEADQPSPLVLTATDGSTVSIWTYPNDPALPALAPATVPGAAESVLSRLGLSLPDAHMEVVTYRPGKRAVVRVTAGDTRVYLKVVRPGRAEDIRRRHTVLAAAGIPVPEVIASSPTGLLVLESLEGPTALDALAAGDIDAEALFTQLLDLEQRFATSDLGDPARPGPFSRVAWYSALLTDALPDHADSIRRAVPAIAAQAARPVPSVPIHGDLHLGQIIVEPTSPESLVTGVLDVDTAGTGHPAEDAAALAGHLTATAVMRGDQTLEQHARLWLRLWTRRNSERMDAHTVDAAYAAHLLAHASGPAQSGDIALAASLVERAVDAARDLPSRDGGTATPDSAAT